jgi:hypothetical protein
VDGFPRSLVFVAVFAGTCALAGAAFGGAGYALLAAAMLAVSMGPYYLPTGYVLDDHAAAVRFLGQTHRLPWSEVRRVSRRPAGVFLSRSPRASRLDSFRGTFLRFAGNADEVMSFVRDKTAQVE